MSFLIIPYTIHEAEIAIFHSWSDGKEIKGPMKRHLESGLVAKFNASLSFTRIAAGESMRAFGDWRKDQDTREDGWQITMSYPYGAIKDHDGTEVSSSLEIKADYIILVRFYDQDSQSWRMLQFHYARIDDNLPANETQEVIMNSLSFHAGWREEFKGGLASGLPDMTPRKWGVIEWVHQGRVIPCYYYDADTDAWMETDENPKLTDLGQTIRYVTLETTSGETTLSMLSPITETETLPSGVEIENLTWVNAQVFTSDSADLHLGQGWQLQTEGCPEPIKMPASSRHWEHPVVRVRFLSRVYGTFGHGTVAVPKLEYTAPPAGIDTPIILGPSLAMLPTTTYQIPA